jgi:hypothetical protein
MTKVAKARVHSVCGKNLTEVTEYEVIPGKHFSFANKEYLETDLPEEMPELIVEIRCAQCNVALTGADLEYVRQRIKIEDLDLEDKD